MAICKIHRNPDELISIERTKFDKEELQERKHLQTMLKAKIDIIAPDTLVVAEEFSLWEDSKRRIDLLAIDKKANLVVIELKRTEDGGNMDLQAIRYASMISTLTFDKLNNTYDDYLSDNNKEAVDAENLLDFLGWSEPEDDNFAQEVKIILASADFSKELTTSVMWLNDFGLDIRCVRMRPYDNDGEILLDVQTIIPLPEVADYQVKIREKKKKEREARNRDFTKYNVTVGGTKHLSQNKRWMMFRIIAAILKNGGKPKAVIDAIPWRRKGLFEDFEGDLRGKGVCEETFMEKYPDKKSPQAKRFFVDKDQGFHFKGKTYVLTNQWGGDRTLEAVKALQKKFPDLKIEISPVDDE